MNENRLEKLDDAFLFAVSFAGLFITIVQVSIFGKSEITSLVEIFPLLFLGIAMPFYIGYLRGAISIRFTNRSIMERMRGWIYMVMGISGYFGFVLSSRLGNLIHRWIVFYFLGAVGLGFAYILRRWFIDVFDVGEKISHQYSFFGTIVSAYFLPFVLRMVVGLYSDLSERPQFSPFLRFLLVFFVWVTWCALMVCIVYEKVSREVINAEHCLDVEHLEGRRCRNFFIKLVLLNTDIYSFVWRESTNLQAWVLWTQALAIWFLGIILFALRFPIYPEAYLLTSIVLLGLGTNRFRTMTEIDFSNLGLT